MKKKKSEHTDKDYIVQAKVLEEQKKYNDAILAYQKATDLNSKQPFWIYKKLGDLQRKQGQLEASILALQKATEMQPDNPNIHFSLGLSFHKRGDLERAIYNYQKTIELNPEQSFWVYKELGDALKEQGKLEEALSNYQKVVEQKSDIYARFHINMGDIYDEQQKWQDAVTSYQKALSIDPYLGERIYFAIRHAQLKQGQRSEAVISYQNAIKRRYLISHKCKIIYCPIPKNACSLFKTIIVENSDDKERYKQSNQNIHLYTYINDKGVSLNDFSYLKNPDYFKFVILRNPFDRLVSAYIEKFARRIKPPSFVRDVIKDVYEFLDIKPDFYKSITFSQFIQYLVRTEDYKLNPHWRPQSTFLGEGLFNFDFIGQFEKLDSVISDLEEKFSIKIRPSSTRHMTNYQLFINNEKFHNKYPEELRQMDGFPKANQLYTPELEKLVRKKFAEDIQIYESEFNITLPSY